MAGTTERHKQKERVTHLLFFCCSKEQGHLFTASVKHTRGLGFHCCRCLAFDRLPLSQGGQNTFYHLSLPPHPTPLSHTHTLPLCHHHPTPLNAPKQFLFPRQSCICLVGRDKEGQESQVGWRPGFGSHPPPPS